MCPAMGEVPAGAAAEGEPGVARVVLAARAQEPAEVRVRELGVRVPRVVQAVEAVAPEPDR